MSKKMHCSLFLPNNVLWVVAFCDVEQQILKELFFNRGFFCNGFLMLIFFGNKGHNWLPPLFNTLVNS
jgi:hypothetical protein